MTRYFSKPHFSQYTPFLTSLLLSFYFIALYLMMDYLYSGISDKTLRFYYHDYFITFCALTIDLIAPERSVQVIQNAITSNGVNLAFVRSCDGSTAFFLISSAILMFRSTVKKTILGIFMGLVFILFLNTIRIVSLYFLMAYNPVWFSYTHETIAPFLLLSFSTAYFSFWALYAKEEPYGKV